MNKHNVHLLVIGLFHNGGQIQYSFVLRATLPKILIFNFHPEIDFAHNPSFKFTWQVGNKYEVISEKLNFFKIF